MNDAAPPTGGARSFFSVDEAAPVGGFARFRPPLVEVAMPRLSSLLAIFLALAGCSDGGEPSDAGSTDDTPSDDAGQGSGTCGVMRDGAWEASGTCFGDDRTMTVTTSGCDVVFSSWSGAEPGPSSAIIDERTVRFSGNGFAGCTGTLAGSGRSVEGSCPSNATVGACDLTLTQP